MARDSTEQPGSHPRRIVLPRILPASLDPDAVKVIRRLRQHGHEAYLVGGCVRDLSLGRIPKDFDVATSARPRVVKRLFRNSRIIGRRFKLVHVLFGDKTIEVSTFRRNPREDGADEPTSGGEGGGEDRPAQEAEEAESRDLLIRRDNVFGTAEEDAVRRDFTINGLFFDVQSGEVIDYVGGVADLEAGLVRTIGDPDIRFQEDPVRILRALRFAAKLGFTIEENTWQAILRHQHEIAKCAMPRVAEELFRLLACGAARETWRLLDVTGVLATVLPEIAEFLETAGSVPEWPAPPREQLVAYFEAVDRIDRGRRVVSNALLLTVLFVGPIRHAMAGGGVTLGEAVERVVRPIAQRMSLPRRDTYRLQQVLQAQPKLREGPSGGRKRRKIRPRELARREYFKDALDFFHVETLALQRPREPLDAWMEIYYRVLRESDPKAYESLRRLGPFDQGAGAAEERAEMGRRARTGAEGASSDVVVGRRRRRAAKRSEEAAPAGEKEAGNVSSSGRVEAETHSAEGDGSEEPRGRRRKRRRTRKPQHGETGQEGAGGAGDAEAEAQTGGSRRRRATSEAGRKTGGKKGRRASKGGSGRSKPPAKSTEPARLDFDEVRAGPLRPEEAGVAAEVEEEPEPPFDPNAPLATVDDPGPISVIQTGVDRTETKSRRRRRKKDPAARELSKEVEDQPGLQALKMADGDPRGHEVTRPRKKLRHELLAEQERRQRKPKEPPFDPRRDWESVEDLYGW